MEDLLASGRLESLDDQRDYRLTLLVEKAKSCVSKDYVGIAIGILFKYSAALLDVQQGSDDQVSFILNSLAYHHLCMVALKDVMISAWIAMHLLEVAAAITCSNVTEDQISHLWHREDLAEYCVDTLIPSEGCIQRLHSGVYRNGVIECHTCWPTITVKQICNLFDRIQPVLHREEILRTIVWMIGHDSTFEEMALFDDLLQKSLSNSSDLNSATLTTTDVKVFRWLEANVDDKSWLTVYATTISDTITRYLASELLLKKEFGEAERKLV
uniref:Cyclin N-terminal domain-containing protein n=1 Tax=Angiostrongylus cantonensis TaxID=6313 RepID=A0A0K0DRA2_ANGCA